MLHLNSYYSEWNSPHDTLFLNELTYCLLVIYRKIKRNEEMYNADEQHQFKRYPKCFNIFKKSLDSWRSSYFLTYNR
ncbi:PRD domain-containing protein [Bacillus cereus group sp. TH152-1LC]|uniref:PRD domain-containing protein n=1 Tax=Bacillus cereus group sp. TH152-1LC TaxID=3018060 RepID=UPI003FA4C586